MQNLFERVATNAKGISRNTDGFLSVRVWRSLPICLERKESFDNFASLKKKKIYQECTHEAFSYSSLRASRGSYIFWHPKLCHTAGCFLPNLTTRGCRGCFCCASCSVCLVVFAHILHGRNGVITLYWKMFYLHYLYFRNVLNPPMFHYCTYFLRVKS